MDDPRVSLQADLKEAMRAQDRRRLSVIRMALNAIKQEEIDRQVKLSAEEAAAVLMREAKKRRESITEAEQAGRLDVASEEQAELAILESYLPRQLSTEEIADLARAAIREVGASSPKDIGNVMRVLMPRLKGQAEGSLVNQIVRDLLVGS
ncbi:MAG: GatB/YqeY domain-containing protein [Anaerolineae bacterium]|nr:GatB/YqeY domain-containing protein [Anaerolineae bacterium]